VASYLALDLGVDWRRGADLFENLLLDHDVCSNWGNWVAAAGQTGGRINHFNITKQSKVGTRCGQWTVDRCLGLHAWVWADAVTPRMCGVAVAHWHPSLGQHALVSTLRSSHAVSDSQHACSLLLPSILTHPSWPSLTPPVVPYTGL
jgi:hypothetical protein